MCAFVLIFMWKSCTCTWNTNWFISASTDLVLHVMQGHPVASSMPSSAYSPSSSVLEKPSQTAVAKGGCVCENTHLSPADGSFSGHTVLPARLPSRAWPSPQPAQQATGITSPCWQDPFYGLRVRNTSSNAGQYPAFPWPLRSIQSSTNTPVCDVSAATMQRYSALVVSSSLLFGIKYESAALKRRVSELRRNCLWMVLKWAVGLAFCFPRLPAHTQADSCACASCLSAKAMCFPPVWCGEMSIAVAFKRIKNQTPLCCRRIFSTIPPGAPDKFRCEAFTPKTSITSTC